MYYYAWGWWWILWAAVFLIFILGFSGWGFGGSRGRSKRATDEGTDRFGSYFPLSYPIGKYTGTGPKNYHRSDERILEEVSDRLTLHGEIDASGIDVSVDHGVVVVQGSVDSRRTKRLVEEIAESVTGVLDVKNDLVVGGAKRAVPPAERKVA